MASVESDPLRAILINNARDEIVTIASSIDAPDDMVTAATRLLEHGADDPPSRANPGSVAAGAVYAVSDATDHPEWTITQATLADVAGIDPVTVSDHWPTFAQYTYTITHLLPESPTDTSVDRGADTETDSVVDTDCELATIPAETLYQSPPGHETRVTVCFDGQTRTYQNGTAMLTDLVDTLITDYDLLDTISLPYVIPNCENPFITTDPDVLTDPSRWSETETGYYVDTKLNIPDRIRRLQHLANRVGTELTPPQ